MAFAVLRVRNVGSTTFKDRWEGQWFAIPPKGDLICPQEAVWAWFGKPDLIDSPHRPDRRDAFNRLKNYYGAWDDPVRWEENKPKVEVTDSDGERVWTIVEDPLGEHVTPASTTNSEKEAYGRMIEGLQRQIDDLKSQRKMLTEPGETDEEVPEDSPIGAPRRGRAAS